MKQLNNIFYCVLIGLAFLLPERLSATHIRAGEIIAERTSQSSREYIFTFIGFRDLTPGEVIFGEGLVDFGDDSFDGQLKSLNELDPDGPDISNVGNETERWEFRFTHEFPANGTYTISYREFNRNGGIANMNNSVNTPFYIETQISIFPEVGFNSTPKLLIPPIDLGCTNVAFIHNPGAFDKEGDSISYKLVIPRQNMDLQVENDGLVDGYRFPADPSLYNGVDWDDEDGNSPALFSLDSIIGDVVWNAPGLAGEYNIAFIIEEWRFLFGEWVRIGYVTRDMQVIIDECNNERPEVLVPLDTCIEAGTILVETIRGTDPDSHDVKLEAFGGPFELNSSPAFFGPTNFQSQPAEATFTWQTNCTHVRERPYEIRFKVTDNPSQGPSLVNFATWNVTVVGPAPIIDTVIVQSGRRNLLQWQDYTCQATADIMQIWRRVDSFDFDPTGCEIGIPENSGYELIAEVDIGVTAYLDDNNGQGLDVGANYCYRLVAVYPPLAGGLSYASNEKCGLILADAPVMTNVDITSTGETDGEIFVQWASPFSVDVVNFPPPFRYELYRASGFNGNNDLTFITSTMDTVFTDTGLNTDDQVYNYRVRLFDSNDNFVDSSAIASSVRLEPSPAFESILLNWSADVPWSIQVQDFPLHYIYRDRVLVNFPDSLVLVDSVIVTATGLNYLDNGSFNGEKLDDELLYCYFVTTFGSYGNDSIEEPLINRSQIICAQPNDTIPPCKPISLDFVELGNGQTCEQYLADKPCDFNDWENELNWENDGSNECTDDIRSYNVYYSRTGREEDFELLTNTVNSSYSHNKFSPIPLLSLAGCYQVSAVDRSGNESEFSEIICRDNCPYFELPNVFTPNEDGINDTFKAFGVNEGAGEVDFSRCPRFVEAVKITVYNRHGVEVYSFNSEDIESDILNWDGRGDNGKLLSAGIYYYVADVQFTVLDPEKSLQQVNGWVHILY